MSKRRFIIFNFAAVLVLIGSMILSCPDPGASDNGDNGGGSSDTGNVSGTMTLDAAHSNFQYLIVLEKNDAATAQSMFAGTVIGTTATIDYEFSDEPVGSYFIYGLVDTDNNGSLADETANFYIGGTWSGHTSGNGNVNITKDATVDIDFDYDNTT